MMIIKSEVCPVCNANEWQCVYEIAPWKILKCPNCSFSKIDPFGKVESRKEFYNQENIEKRGQKKKDPLVQFFWHLKKWAKRITRRDKNKIFYKRLQKRLKPHSHILDIGCGAGAFLAHAKERFECTGNEVSEYLAGLAKQQGAKEVVVGDFLSADFQEKTFNGITMISLIEHLSNPKAALEKCYDLLEDDGVFLLKTVNYNCLNRVIRKNKWTGFRPPDHMVYFTPSNLAQLLKNIGFKKVSTFATPLNDNFYCDAYK